MSFHDKSGFSEYMQVGIELVSDRQMHLTDSLSTIPEIVRANGFLHL